MLGFDNWRTGISLGSSGPQAGYFPFYLSLILAGAILCGLVTGFHRAGRDQVFVTRAISCARVMQVFVPTSVLPVSCNGSGSTSRASS